MTKTEFVAELAKETGAGKSDAERMLNAVLETIQKTIQKGESVQFTGFGTFEVQEEERTYRVGPIRKATQKIPVFKAGKKLRDAAAN